jgi:restriction system protein
LEAYQYSPELLQALNDAIPKLCRSKQDVITYFRSAGVPHAYLQEWEHRLATDANAVRKAEITRDLLRKLNEGGDSTLRERRELLKRVTETEDYSSSWPTDRLEAEGLVARIRKLVNVRDSFTRMSLEREREATQARREKLEAAEAATKRNEEFNRIRDDLFALFGETNAQARGKKLEGVLNRLFKTAGILVRESFVRSETGIGVVEQIDGVIEIDGELYLVEIKWWNEKIGVPEVTQHISRLFIRADCRGLIISASGFTDAAIQACKDALSQRTVVLAELEEVVAQLNNGSDLKEWIKKKVASAILNKTPLIKVAQ